MLIRVEADGVDLAIAIELASWAALSLVQIKLAWHQSEVALHSDRTLEAWQSIRYLAGLQVPVSHGLHAAK